MTHTVWTEPCAYNPTQKARFHRTAKQRLKQLAAALGLQPGSYDLRSNKAGIAVSGEITLHHDQLYVQVSQSTFDTNAVLYRRCAGRKDYVGDRNHFAALELLDEPERLASLMAPLLNPVAH